jgi:hypothetical protein
MDRETVKISSLKAAPYNPRKISGEALSGLSKSLERWGVVQEVVANKRTGHIVGGHQRVAALKKMGAKEVPVVWVDLDDVEEKALNVALNNPHISGEFDDTIAGLLSEIRDGIGPDDFAELKLDDLVPSADDILGEEKKQDDGLSENYSRKIEAPVYRITGKKPDISDLIDRSKTQELRQEILVANLPSEISAFLLHAAERHTVFSFSHIAEFYAHSDENVQDLMERSALVIIDFDKAVERGFVKLAQGMMDQVRSIKEQQ